MFEKSVRFWGGLVAQNFGKLIRPSKNALEFFWKMANKPNVIAPMLLGYLVGSVGIYTLLYKVSPVVSEDINGQASVHEPEIIELFPEARPADQVRAA